MIDHRATDIWEAAIAAERAGLVRLCRHLTGDAQAAEDLVQETLLEAWRHWQQVQDAEGTGRWLAAIARNVCLRWRRRRGREIARRAPMGLDDEASATDLADAVPDDVDFEVELERDELAELLDRALSLLPPETRQVLIERYIWESSLEEMTTRLGLSRAAATKKLQRGRLVFRRVLATDFRDELAAYGFVVADSDAWERTRLWCPWCGQERLLGRFGERRAALDLRCPRCCPAPGAHVASAGMPALFRGVKGYRAAYSRLLGWSDRYFAAPLDRGALPCHRCGRPTRLLVDPLPDGCAAGWQLPCLHLRCAACGSGLDYTLGGRLLALPEARHFWRGHPRLCLIPARQIEAAGSPALVMGFADVTGRARLEVVCARDTLAVLAVHGAPR